MLYLSVGRSSRRKKDRPSADSRFAAPAERRSIPTLLIVVSVCIAAVTVAVYLPAVQNDFTNWDDNLYIYDNPFIRALDVNLLKAAFLGFHASNWHPLTWLSHAVDYAIFGLNPAGHHAVSILLHALNTLIVVLLTAKILRWRAQVFGGAGDSQGGLAILAAAITGVLFGLHPIHVESVVWACERKDVLSAFFFLLSIAAYVKYVSARGASSAALEGRRIWLADRSYWLSVFFCALALMSKPMAVSLPLVLLLLDWYPFDRVKSGREFALAFIEKLPFIAMSCVSAGLTLIAQKTAIVETISPDVRMLVAGESLVRYLLNILWPAALVPYYPYPETVAWSVSRYLVPVGILAVITAYCIYAAVRRQKVWLAAWAYFVIVLAPVMGIVQAGGQSMADRYAYLPSISPFLIVGLSASALLIKTRSPLQWKMPAAAVIVSAVVILIALPFLTVRQISVWKDSRTLWEYVTRKEPTGVLPHNNLGTVYLAERLYDGAIAEFREAVRLRPGYLISHYNLGNAYKASGMLDAAIEEYRTAIRLKPDLPLVHNDLGALYKAKGQVDLAIEEYQYALRFTPGSSETHHNLGLAYAHKGLADKAIIEFREAVRLKPDNVDAHYNLGVALAAKGEHAAAIAEYQTALRLNPNSATAHNNLGTVYLVQGQTKLAMAEFQQALRLRPGYKLAQLNLDTIMRGGGAKGL